MRFPYAPLFLSAAAMTLAACEPQTIDTMTPSETGDARYTLTQDDLVRMEPAEMVDQMILDMENLTDLFSRTQTQADVEGALRQVELSGINYRTMMLRVERAVDQGEADIDQALLRQGDRLRRAHADLMATGDRLRAAYPDIRRDVDERFDKFAFGRLVDAD